LPLSTGLRPGRKHVFGDNSLALFKCLTENLAKDEKRLQADVHTPQNGLARHLFFWFRAGDIWILWSERL